MGEGVEKRPLGDAPARADRGARPLRTATLAVMAIAALLSGWLSFRLLSEARFALSEGHATDVGALPTADLAGRAGQFVRARVTLDDPALTFERPLGGVPHRVSRAEGGDGDAARWVIHPVPRSVAGPRYVPPSLVAGRLARLGDLGVRFRGVAPRLEGASPDDWVLVDGEDPTNMVWVLGLEAMLLFFVAFNLVSIVRVVRPVRRSPDRPSR